MTVSSKGSALIEQFEGLRLAAYQDGGGIWTLGYGHTNQVKAGDTCTSAQADEWLDSDIASAERAVNAMAHVALTQGQFDALVSFAYNLGPNALQESTLLRLMNSGNPALAASEFPKWDHVAGQVSEGLSRRRMAEQALFLEVAV